jgi:hypothetical protein
VVVRPIECTAKFSKTTNVNFSIISSLGLL